MTAARVDHAGEGEYTPTMEVVRTYYSADFPMSADLGNARVLRSPAEFDRAMAAHDASLRATIAAETRNEIAGKIDAIAAKFRATVDEWHRIVMAGEPHDFSRDDILRYNAYATSWESAARHAAAAALGIDTP